MDSRQREEIIREYPINIWTVALILFAVAIYGYYQSMSIGITIGIAGAGLLVLLLSRLLIVEFADSRRVLLLRRIGIISRKVDELPVSNIQSVFVQQSRRRDNRNSPSYRVVIAMKDGETYPLRSYYSGGALRNETAAEKIRLAVGVGGHDQTTMGMLEMGSKLFSEAYQPNGVALDEMAAQETNGVRWQMQTIPLGASPVTRWLSKDFTYPGQFLYLAQKLEGQESGKKIMAMMGKTLFRQSMRMYGFGDADTPNIDRADQMEIEDHRLDEHFLCYASDPIGAKRLLSSLVVGSLSDWAERHPLRQGVKQTDNFSQLVILFSPNGAYLSCLGELKDSETEELVNLGVELVNAQAG